MRSARAVKPRLFLASSSPRRQELLRQIGVAFELLPAWTPELPLAARDVDESGLAGETAEQHALRVAQAKLEMARHRLLATGLWSARSVILAADTLLDLDGRSVGKPRDDSEAANILHALSGRAHQVLTAVVVADAERQRHILQRSQVRLRTLSAEEIARYIASGEGRDKAGSYALQGRAAMFVSEIGGSPSGIVGLPLCETALLLREFGLDF